MDNPQRDKLPVIIYPFNDYPGREYRASALETWNTLSKGKDIV